MNTLCTGWMVWDAATNQPTAGLKPSSSDPQVNNRKNLDRIGQDLIPYVGSSVVGWEEADLRCALSRIQSIPDRELGMTA